MAAELHARRIALLEAYLSLVDSRLGAMQLIGHDTLGGYSDDAKDVGLTLEWLQRTEQVLRHGLPSECGS